VSKTYTYSPQDLPYGNLTSSTTTTTDKDATSPYVNQAYTTTASRIFNYSNGGAANWCIGIPERTTLQNTLPSNSSQTRTHGIPGQGVDYPNCRVTTDYDEPTNAALATTTTYQFDTCGNISSSGVVGSNPDGSQMAARTTLFGYGSRCQFAELVTDPLGQQTHIYPNYGLGVADHITDANQLTTYWTYDDFGRKKHEFLPDNTTKDWTYTDCNAQNDYCGSFVFDYRMQTLEVLGDNTGSQGAPGVEVSRGYLLTDGFDRTRETQTRLPGGGWSSVLTTYDSLGRRSTESLPFGTLWNGKHQYVYDVVGRLTADQIFDASGALNRQTHYQYAGRTQTTIGAKTAST
jgi:YD repeat-containing protein